MARSSSWPRSTAIFAKTLLHEYCNAVRIVAFSQGAFGFSLVSSVVVPGRVYGSGLSVFSSTEPYSPFSSAAAATTSLNVEPGGSGWRSARLVSGLSGSLVSCFQAVPAVFASVSDVGSYEGVDTTDRILPVFGSIATAAPFVSPSASNPAFCTSGSIVVTTLPGSARVPVTVSSTVFSRGSVPLSTSW
ncbi:hypothetical protein RKD37_006759 [Streptomyces ambofaciens]